MPAHPRKKQKREAIPAEDTKVESQHNEEEKIVPASAFAIMENGLTRWGVGQGRDEPSMVVPMPDPNMRPLILSLSNEILEMICSHINDPAALIIFGSTCRKLRDFVNAWGGIWQRFLPSQHDKPYNPKASYRQAVLDVLNRKSRTGCQICLRPRVTTFYRGFQLRLCPDCFYQNSIPRWKGKLYNLRVGNIRRDEKRRMRDVYHGWWIADVRRQCVIQHGKSKTAIDAEREARENETANSQRNNLQRILETALEYDAASPESPATLLGFMDETLRRQHFVECIHDGKFGNYVDMAKRLHDDEWYKKHGKMLASWQPKCCSVGGDKWSTGKEGCLRWFVCDTHTMRVSFHGCLPQATVQAALVFHTARIMATIWLRDRAAHAAQPSLLARTSCPVCDEPDRFTPSQLAVHFYMQHGEQFWTRRDWFIYDASPNEHLPPSKGGFIGTAESGFPIERFWAWFALPSQANIQGIANFKGISRYDWQHKGWMKEDVEVFIETIQRGFIAAMDVNQVNEAERQPILAALMKQMEASKMIPPIAIPEEPVATWYKSEFSSRETSFV